MTHTPDSEIISNSENMIIDYLTEQYEGDTPDYVRISIAGKLAPELLECLIALEDIISGLEAELDNAGIGDMVECRDWWRKAQMIINKAEGK